MPNPIAEAFVEIRPDFSSFDSQLQQGVNKAFRGLRVPSGTQQQLGQQLFGPGLSVPLQRNISNSLKNTKVDEETQRTLAQQLFGPGFRNESGRAIQGTLAGAGLGGTAAQFAFFGAGGAALAILTAGLVKSVDSAAQFEQSLNTLQAVAGLTDEQLKQFSDTAKALGADLTLPAVTAQTAADAMTELARAGLSAQDTLDATRGVLQLATAANTDAATAAQVTASALNAFGLAGTEAVHVADLLAGASIAAQGDIGDMALALQQSATVAKLTGVSIEQLTGLITELARAGIRGSDAGTSLRTGLLRLVPTTKEAAQLMEVLGIQIDKTQTIGQQLPDLLDQYQAAFARLTPTTRQAVLQQIAGTDAVRSLSIAIAGGSKGLEASIRASNRVGAANDLATAKTKGLTGAVQGLQSTVQTLGVNIGNLFVPPLTVLVDVVNELITPVNDLFTALDHLKTIGSIHLDVQVDLPDVPGSSFLPDIPGLDVTKQLLRTFAPGIGLFDSLTDKAKAFSSVLQSLGLTDAADEMDQLAAKAEDLNKELFASGTTPARRREIQAELVVLDKQLSGIPTKAKTAQKSIDDIFKGTPSEFLLTGPLDALAERAKTVIDPNVLGRQLRVAIKAMSDPSLSSAAQDTLAELVRSRIGELSKLGPEGKRVLRALGGDLMKALGDGITAEGHQAIDAARATLEQVSQQGTQAILSAITSARSNLESLGSTLGGQLSDIIDVSPIGKAIEEINKQLDDLQERTQRRDLRFDFTEAKNDLKDAQDSIRSVGVLTPAQKRAQAEFLEPFKEKVKDAKAALKEFDLTDHRDDLQKTLDEQKKVANEGLQVLIDRFEEGKISVGEFDSLLTKQLGPHLATLAQNKENLGFVFTRDFKREMSTLVAQAEALAGFTGRAGTTPGTQVTKPAQTVADVQRQLASAQAALADAIKNAKEENSSENDDIILILKQIRNRLGVGGPGKGG